MWQATENVEMPGGLVTDTVNLEKGRLIAKQRHLKQGTLAIDVAYADGKATGTMTMNGQSKSINVDLGGPVFAESAATLPSLAALPLAEGYKTTYRNFDLQRQKSKVMQVSVAGSEKVTVPAGAFDVYKLEVTSAEGGSEKLTLWIAKDQHKAVKYQMLLPQMNGATLDAELTQ